MPEARRDFIPALNRSFLTPFYDPLLRYILREEVFKQRLIDLASPRAGEQVLDLGCGTGTLTILLARAQPAAHITGLDADPVVLEIARHKAGRENLPSIRWNLGMAGQLPYQAGSFDLVVSSLMIHHLTPDGKLGAFREVYRVLKPGGRFHIVDFGPPHDAFMRLVTVWMAHLEQTADHFKGRIPAYLQAAGFAQVAESDHLRVALGPLSFYRAVRPA